MTEREYVDIEEIHPYYRKETCWNCGNTRQVKRRWTVCKQCFMGQEQGEAGGNHTTSEGYVNYGTLWYGKDATLEEMKAQYQQTREEMRTNMPTNRVVRL